jgi:hypothetical protein
VISRSGENGRGRPHVSCISTPGDGSSKESDEAQVCRKALVVSAPALPHGTHHPVEIQPYSYAGSGRVPTSLLGPSVLPSLILPVALSSLINSAIWPRSSAADNVEIPLFCVIGNFGLSISASAACKSLASPTTDGDSIVKGWMESGPGVPGAK